MASSVIGKAVIHYVESDGCSWGSFLQKKLSEAQYSIPTELHEIRAPWRETSKYDVNLALVSPDFLVLDSIENFQRCSTVHSLAILLGTSETEFHESVTRHFPQSRLLKWVCYCPQQTRDSVKGLLLTIINMYENLHGGDEIDDEESCAEDPLFELVPKTSSEDRASMEGENNVDYDTLPPARQINALHDVMKLPGSEEDEYKEILILLERRAESEVMLALDSGENIPTEEIHKAVYKARIHKNLIHDNGIKFFAVSNHQSFGSMECEFDCKSQNNVQQTQLSNETLNQRNNKSSESSSPDPPSGLDIIHDILEKETNPVYLLCEALRIPYVDHEQLDQYLSGKCRRLRVTEHFTELMMKEDAGKDSDSEWPTLLHFCADTNLLQSTNELLQIPCLVSACLKCNRNHETPRDIARRNGFTDMVNLLEKQHTTEQTKDPTGTSLRGKTGGNETRSVDSGVSGLQQSYVDTESYCMDDTTATRMSNAAKSAPIMALSSSASDLRPSGHYDTMTKAWQSRSYQEPAASNPLSDGQREGDSTWFDEHPPQCRFPLRRSSESDKDSIRASNTSRESRKVSGSFGQKKQSFSKTIFKVFKIKRKNSMSSAPEKTIPEEAHISQTATEERGRGFPCSPIVSYDDVQEEEETVLSPEPPMKGTSALLRETQIIEQTKVEHEVPKRSYKKIKNPFKKKIDRRKSLRVSRVLKDNNVVVLALPTKHDVKV
ncbi:uncharacterized protein LOC110459003 isoform X2 [Mizuhopecten yessoensis]|uniref:uncharacterized protein LOC110459003 isoform X2 n=1 Tax=Mizuhopecten yessoensis TaxID=6573 RepID=UPI000B45DF72|nr:uncharacterized protein LOC110459003 isoform X2 [Mizuhopecten yessoensis]